MKKFLLSVLVSLISIATFAVPYLGQTQSFSQPDGTSVEVKLFGDEYYMRAETLNGYTVVRDESSGWICYAKLSADGTSLISTGTHYLGETVVPQNLVSEHKHLDITTAVRKMMVEQTRKTLKADEFEKNFLPKSDQLKALTLPIAGNVKALTIVVDFSDKPATLTKADFENYCNNMNYIAFGNNGSVKRYFSDISGGLLVYDNVVFGIFRAPKTFAQYDAMAYAAGAQEILGLALNWINNQGFDFSTLTIENGRIKAINLMYTGSPATWSKGMWHHASSYGNFSADGVTSGSYNCSPANDPLSIGTVCHENGHMIGGWPDTYKYDSNNGTDGLGWFDLMCGGCFGGNPAPPNPYYIYTAGWANITDVYGFSGTKSDASGSTRDFYRYKNPANSNEYFLFKNYLRTGRTANCPDEGLTIWHIDVAGNNQTTHHQVYLEHANNNKDAHEGACWRADRNSAFNDNSAPDAKWYSGAASNLKVSNVSGIGGTISYQFSSTTVTVTNPIVTFYQDCDFGGSAYGFKSGDYTIATMTSSGLPDNYASSVKVANGYKVDLFKDDNFTGTTTTVSSDNNCLVAAGFNDVLSSFKIKANGVTTLAGTYFIKNRVSGEFMEISGAGLDDGGNVLQWPYSGSTNQKWQLTHLGDGVYSIINKNSGKCLDIAGISTADGANAHQWTYLGSDNQKFIIQQSNTGFYQLIASHSSKVIEVAGASTADGANVQQWPDNGQQCSEWELIPINTRMKPRAIMYQDCNFTGSATNFATGDYAMANMTGWGVGDNSISSIKVAPGFKATVYADDNYTGTSLAVGVNNSCLVSNNLNDLITSFKVRPNGNPNLGGKSYFLKNRNSGRYLEVEGASMANGANIRQWDYNGGDNQKWALTHLGDGVYSVFSVKSALSMDVWGANDVSGSNVSQGTINGGENQQFIIQATTGNYYHIIALHSAQYIKVVTAEVANNGGNVVQGTDGTGTESEWELVAQSYSAEANYETTILPFTGFEGSTFEKIANPIKSGINTSATVGKSTKGTLTYSGITSVTLTNKIDFGTKKLFKLKVYSTIIGNMLLKVESSVDASKFVEVMVQNSKTNTWEDLSFAFTDAASDTYDKVTLFFNFGSTAVNDFYFDDLRQEVLVATDDKQMINENLISIYPNPATDEITVVAPINATIQISDLQGRIILNQSSIGTNKIEVTSWRKGIYLVSILSDTNKTIKKLVIK